MPYNSILYEIYEKDDDKPSMKLCYDIKQYTKEELQQYNFFSVDENDIHLLPVSITLQLSIEINHSIDFSQFPNMTHLILRINHPDCEIIFPPNLVCLDVIFDIYEGIMPLKLPNTIKNLTIEFSCHSSNTLRLSTILIQPLPLGLKSFVLWSYFQTNILDIKIPDTLESLILNDCSYIEEFPQILPNLEFLQSHNCIIKDIDWIPITLRFLEIKSVFIGTKHNEVKCVIQKIMSLLPYGLEYLCIQGMCKGPVFTSLPPNLKYLGCCPLNIDMFDLPKQLRVIDFRQSFVSSIDKIELETEGLMLDDTKIKWILMRPLQMLTMFSQKTKEIPKHIAGITIRTDSHINNDWLDCLI